MPEELDEVAVDPLVEIEQDTCGTCDAPRRVHSAFHFNLVGNSG